MQRICILFVLFASFCLTSSLGFAAAPPDYPPDVKTLRVNGYDMAYTERGSGPTLVLVHGSLSDYRTWAPLMTELSAENRVIALSLRHYYPEHWNGEGNDLSLSEHAKDVSSFIEALGVGPVHLLGHSRGAGVALLAASMHPERIRSLILADVYPFKSLLPNTADVKAEMEKRMAVSRTVLAHFKQHDPEAGLITYVNHIVGPNGWDNTGEAQREHLRSNAWTLLSLLTDAETPLKCTDLSKISAPVLIMTGDRSPPIFAYSNDAAKACLQHAYKVTIPDAGHMMFQANPSAFTTEVQFFVADH
jgi:esterase